MMESVHLMGRSTTPLAILTVPDAAGRTRDTAVIMLNSGLLHRVGPFRLSVTFARQLAMCGFASLRIDQSGKGDSERRRGLNVLESIRRDYEESREFLKRNLGTKSIVVMGLCSGADDVLYLASEFDDIEGAILLDGFSSRTLRYYIHYYGEKALRASSWLNVMRQFLRMVHDRFDPGGGVGEAPDIGALREFVNVGEMRGRFQSIVKRGGKLLCVFTKSAEARYSYKGQLIDCLRLSDGEERISEVFMAEAKHTYPLSAHRHRLIETTCRWMVEEFSERQRGMSRALLKLSGGSVHDYATISDDSPSPSRASRARRAATSAGIS